MNNRLFASLGLTFIHRQSQSLASLTRDCACDKEWNQNISICHELRSILPVLKYTRISCKIAIVFMTRRLWRNSYSSNL